MTQLGTGDPTTLQREASAAFRAGDTAAGIPAYRRLLALRPDLPDSWFNFAMLQRRAGDFAGALESYAQALAHGITGPEEAHLQRGVIFADDLGRSDAARIELDAALALQPDYLPAWLNLGNWHEDRGDITAARAAYARAVEIDPGDALAAARLAGVSTPAGPDDIVLAGLRRIAASARPAQDRADAGFALGAALDRLHCYDQAFAAYAAANGAAREIAAAAGMRYDRAAQTAFVDRLVAAFPARVPPVPEDSDAPLFVCGMFRSGSTLLETILARHEALTAGGELDALPALIAAELLPYPDRATALDPARRAALRERYLAATRDRHQAGTRLIDKRPDNVLHIGLIKTLFPAAQILHTVRDPRDVALSTWFLHAGPALAYATDLGDIAHYHGEQARLMAHWRALYGDDIRPVDYDRLVVDPRATLAPVLAALGLDWQDRLLDPAATDGAIRTASNLQVRRPLYRSSSGRWRHYARHLDSARNAVDAA